MCGLLRPHNLEEPSIQTNTTIGLDIAKSVAAASTIISNRRGPRLRSPASVQNQKSPGESPGFFVSSPRQRPETGTHKPVAFTAAARWRLPRPRGAQGPSGELNLRAVSRIQAR